MNKIARVDVFVIFDTVQLPRGKSRVLRAKYLDERGEKWLTIPFGKKGDLAPIRDIQLEDLSWRAEHLQKLRNAYRRAPHFDWAMETVSACLESQSSRFLVDIEERILERLASSLGLSTRFVRASDLAAYQGMSLQEYVITLLDSVGAGVYLSGRGGGSERTIDMSLFGSRGIQLEYQDYQIPAYRQLWSEEFLSTVSVLDALFMVGADVRRAVCGI
jgi:hypothetical protein